MSKYSFGKRSQAKLLEADERLQRVALRALAFDVMDFSVYEAYRSLEKQKKMFDEGKSHIDGINKKGEHNYMPSKAIDILPYPGEINGVNVWDDEYRLSVLVGLMLAAAAIEGVKIRCGADWDGDGNHADHKLIDYPHFELAE